MTKQSLDAVRRILTIEQPRTTEEEARKHLVAFARADSARILTEQTGRAGVRPSVQAYANTPGNKNIDSVKLPGPIVYVFDYRAEIVELALKELRAASPVRSGKYRDSHTVLLNGSQVDVLPKTLSDTDEIVIVNPVPYARRLEIGKTKDGRDFVLQVPNRIYERVAKQKIVPKYRNVADIQFNYIELTGAHTIMGGLTESYVVGTVIRSGRNQFTSFAKGDVRRRKRNQKVGQAVKAPAIFIRAFK